MIRIPNLKITKTLTYNSEERDPNDDFEEERIFNKRSKYNHRPISKKISRYLVILELENKFIIKIYSSFGRPIHEIKQDEFLIDFKDLMNNYSNLAIIWISASSFQVWNLNKMDPDDHQNNYLIYSLLKSIKESPEITPSHVKSINSYFKRNKS